MSILPIRELGDFFHFIFFGGGVKLPQSYYDDLAASFGNRFLEEILQNAHEKVDRADEFYTSGNYSGAMAEIRTFRRLGRGMKLVLHGTRYDANHLRKAMKNLMGDERMGVGKLPKDLDRIPDDRMLIYFSENLGAADKKKLADSGFYQIDMDYFGDKFANGDLWLMDVKLKAERYSDFLREPFIPDKLRDFIADEQLHNQFSYHP